MARFATALLYAFPLLMAIACHTAVGQGFKFVEAKVLNENGKPMSEVSIEIKMDGLNFALSTDKLGMVSLNISNGNRPVALCVRHEGYEILDKKWDRGIDVPAEYSFQMQPGKPAQGTVFDLDGNPVLDAVVLHAPFDEELTFENGRPAKKSKQRSVTSDDEGKFTLPFQPRGSTIACVSDSGWAQFIKSDEHNDQQLEIRLTPWATVQIQSQLDDDLLGGGRLGLHFVNGLGKDRGKVTWLYEGESDRQGRYTCDRVIPGTAMAYRTVTPRVARGKRPVKYRSHGVITTLASAQSQEINFGVASRGARGRLFKPISYQGTVNWDGGYVALTENNPIDLVLRTAMFEYGKLLGQSGVMRPDQRVPPSVTPNYLVRYLAVVEDDGSFVIENVPPGQYKLSAVLPANSLDDPNRKDVLKLNDLPVSLLSSESNDSFDVGEHILSTDE